MRFAVTARAAITPTGVLDQPMLLIEDGRIAALGPRSEMEVPAHTAATDFPDAILAPALFDIHCHGSAGHDVMEDSTSGQQAMAEFLAKHGVGQFLPTTVTADADLTLRALERLADWIEQTAAPGAATPVGIHLEGPFICATRRGVQPAEFITAPDIAVFDRFQQAARGHIRLMTLAAEQPGGMDLLRHAVSGGVRVSLGHSDATAAQAREAIAAGAASATHTFNAMRGMEHREAGLAGAVLADDRLWAELICDGQHVAPEVVKVWARCKPADRRILITDAISATGMGDGQFRLGPLDVEVSGDRCLYEGKLAGSVLTLDRAVRNLTEWAGIPAVQAWQAASQNPARMLGLRPQEIAAGNPATFLVLAHDCALAASWSYGERLI